eukprot:TRINITY_DN14940_c0_g1_i2.p1 TRINITY_DN14940_c0_g1~~TRINITY_DN14940_c0_g1_i2.p1  ORF type:complete len:197 (-),score=43.66 TRINITY_DN14940_c0_g1_i2:82-672(-)
MIFMNQNGWNGTQEHHPFHLHGHTMWILGSGLNSNVSKKLNLRNPIVRDSFTLQKDGWVHVRFVANNPGVWLMHCHTISHEIMGESFAIAYKSILPTPPDGTVLCGSFLLSKEMYKDLAATFIIVSALALMTIVVLFVYIRKFKDDKRDRYKDHVYNPYAEENLPPLSTVNTNTNTSDHVIEMDQGTNENSSLLKK